MVWTKPSNRGVIGPLGALAAPLFVAALGALGACTPVILPLGGYQDATPASAPAARLCAEWEPALGSVIAWPFALPDPLVVELSRDDRLWVLVAGGDAERAARARLAALGVELARVTFVQSTVQAEWTRDYGPQLGFTAAGEMVVVDPIYVHTPLFGVNPRPVLRGDRLDYIGRVFPGDDRTNVAMARALRLALDRLPAYLTGGNLLVDGRGAGFTTRAMLDENALLMSPGKFRALVAARTGVERLHVLGNTEAPVGIQHIDCWLKLLDEETLLVKRAPADHPEAALVEKNLAILTGLRTPHGRPYRIVRIDTPRYRGDLLAAYTNSLILNRKVLVPLFGDAAADDGALRVYREALPGYQILGFPWEQWHAYDALHCRVRGIFDPGMLYLDHARLADGLSGVSQLPVDLRTRDYSGAGLAAAPVLFWRRSGEEWRRVELDGDVERGFRGAITAPGAGTAVEYYLEASSRSGRTERLPRSGPAGAFRVTLGD